jgi:hypothetical protein
MTYVIALKLPNVSALIADCRVTHDDGIGEDARLKLGKLAPGIIFARVGSEKRSHQFITTFQERLEGVTDTTSGYWQRLVDFVSAYTFHSEPFDYFELILSTRAFGEPQFFILSSTKGKLVAPDIDSASYISTYGSGQELLDSYVFGEGGLPHPLNKSFMDRLITVNDEYSGMGHDSMIFQLQAPYYICLWLSELTLTSERSNVNAEGVGGPFHFVYQTRELEDAQEPAVYVLTQYDLAAFAATGKYQASSSFCRVAYVWSALVIESFLAPNHNPNLPDGGHTINVIYDPAVRPELLDYDPIHDRERLIAEVNEELELLPFFSFCGMGYWYPEARERTAVLARSNGTRESIYKITDENTTVLSAELSEFVRSNFEQVIRKHPDYWPPHIRAALNRKPSTSHGSDSRK